MKDSEKFSAKFLEILKYFKSTKEKCQWCIGVETRGISRLLRVPSSGKSELNFYFHTEVKAQTELKVASSVRKKIYLTLRSHVTKFSVCEINNESDILRCILWSEWFCFSCGEPDLNKSLHKPAHFHLLFDSVCISVYRQWLHYGRLDKVLFNGYFEDSFTALFISIAIWFYNVMPIW